MSTNVGIFNTLNENERVEYEEIQLSKVCFEKKESSWFLDSKSDTILGKIYLTSERLLVLQFMAFSQDDMKVDKAGLTIAGTWFEIPLSWIKSVGSSKKGLLKAFSDESQSGVLIHIESPLEREVKGFFGTKRVKDNYSVNLFLSNSNVFDMKLQTILSKR
jgi:hypothetical protein